MVSCHVPMSSSEVFWVLWCWVLGLFPSFPSASKRIHSLLKRGFQKSGKKASEENVGVQSNPRNASATHLLHERGEKCLCINAVVVQSIRSVLCNRNSCILFLSHWFQRLLTPAPSSPSPPLFLSSGPEELKFCHLSSWWLLRSLLLPLRADLLWGSDTCATKDGWLGWLACLTRNRLPLRCVRRYRFPSRQPGDLDNLREYWSAWKVVFLKNA